MAETAESCANCGRTIGKLETPYLWQENTVCKSCYALLSAPEPTTPVPTGVGTRVESPGAIAGITAELGRGQSLGELAARQTARPPRNKRVPPGGVICPNPHCGFVGRPQRKSRGSIIVAIVLLFAGAIPGILYILFTSGSDYFCPQCGMKLRSEHR